MSAGGGDQVKCPETRSSVTKRHSRMSQGAHEHTLIYKGTKKSQSTCTSYILLPPHHTPCLLQPLRVSVSSRVTAGKRQWGWCHNQGAARRASSAAAAASCCLSSVSCCWFVCCCFSCCSSGYLASWLPSAATLGGFSPVAPGRVRCDVFGVTVAPENVSAERDACGGAGRGSRDARGSCGGGVKCSCAGGVTPVVAEAPGRRAGSGRGA